MSLWIHVITCAHLAMDLVILTATFASKMLISIVEISVYVIYIGQERNVRISLDLVILFARLVMDLVPNTVLHVLKTQLKMNMEIVNAIFTGQVLIVPSTLDPVKNVVMDVMDHLRLIATHV